MKRLISSVLVALVLIVAIALLGLRSQGITPAYLASAPAVATGIGAKLLCSSRFVSGFSEAQSFDDLVQYSGILERLSVSYELDRSAVSASFFGLKEKTATFIPGIGCAVDYAGYEMRSALAPLVASPRDSDQPWPAYPARRYGGGGRVDALAEYAGGLGMMAFRSTETRASVDGCGACGDAL